MEFLQSSGQHPGVCFEITESFCDLKDQVNKFEGWGPIKLHYNCPLLSSAHPKFFVNTCDFIRRIYFLKWTFCVKQEYILD